MADIDSGLVAVIIALLAYPIQVLAIPSFLPFFQHLIRLLPLPGTASRSLSILSVTNLYTSTTPSSGRATSQDARPWKLLQSASNRANGARCSACCSRLLGLLNVSE
jgi:hypothetical protein